MLCSRWRSPQLRSAAATSYFRARGCAAPCAVMWAIGLWAVSHVIANGDLRSLLFFGAFGALSLGGTVLIDRKKQLALGSNLARLAEITSNLPFAALLAGRTALRWREIGLLRIAAGLL